MQEEKVYKYEDESGNELFQVVRFEKKVFLQRPRDKAHLRSLYRRRELADALEKEPYTTVFFVEGEKDADRLHAEGLVATTLNFGAGCVWESAMKPLFHAKYVVILPDNDEPGRLHAGEVAKILSRHVPDVRIVQLDGLPERGDVSDWLDAGNSPAELVFLGLRVRPTCSVRPGLSNSQTD